MKFYTDTVSKELLDALVSKGYPYKTIPTDYRTLYDEDGVIVGGYPEYGTMVPTYAEVLDWLSEKEIHISITRISDESWFMFSDKFKPIPKHKKGNVNQSFTEALEKIILLSLDFIELPDNSGISYSISTEK